ncbi:CrcB family protein [Streptomyces sp. NPDC001787]|uniref:fluoride efflux transporter FluC n=1 Tax=unclassified Streptomyces TaxID=2593676 RepID=UPI003321CD77
MSLRSASREPAHPDHSPGRQGPVIAAVAVGGAIGAGARYGAERLWPTGESSFPWTVLLINAVGCLLMGILMVALKERFTGAPALLNPLLGTGVLGGFTTFSHYTDNVRQLFEEGSPGYAVGCLVLTVVAALAGVTAGVYATRAALGLRSGDGVRA